MHACDALWPSSLLLFLYHPCPFKSNLTGFVVVFSCITRTAFSLHSSLLCWFPADRLCFTLLSFIFEGLYSTHERERVLLSYWVCVILFNMRVSNSVHFFHKQSNSFLLYGEELCTVCTHHIFFICSPMMDTQADAIIWLLWIVDIAINVGVRCLSDADWHSLGFCSGVLQQDHTVALILVSKKLHTDFRNGCTNISTKSESGYLSPILASVRCWLCSWW
jgi:hypothetical protein